MRAAVSLGVEPWLSLQDLADPSPEPRDLVLRVEACGICGSDLHMADSMRGAVFGHEFVGTVVGMGSAVEGYVDGDRVVGFPLVGCGVCGACRTGWAGKCRSARLTGAQRQGAYAEYVAVDAAGSFLLPEQVSVGLGAMVEPLAVAHHALQCTEREGSDPVLVLGAGPVGLAVALWALALGAREVVVSDPQPQRRAIAETLGARVIDPTTIDGHDVGGAFADLIGRRPRAIVECVGLPGAIQQAINFSGRDGHITLVGACTHPASIEPIVATSKELTLRFAVYYGREDFAATLAAMTSGSIDPSPLISDEVSLENLPAKFGELKAPNADCKVLIRPTAQENP